jgi:hypothetical protein
MAKLSIEVEFEWISAGELSLDVAGRLAFPALPHSAGCYRLHFGGNRPLHWKGPQRGPAWMTYIGEAGDIADRVQRYRTPGTVGRWTTSRRIERLLRDHLQGGGQVGVEFLTSSEVSLDGKPANLGDTFQRHLLEAAALVAEPEPTAVLNRSILGLPGTPGQPSVDVRDAIDLTHLVGADDDSV